jgi:hypothetical protein
MALLPGNYSTQESLQPGARGEMFDGSGFPGYRDETEGRINRTANRMNVSAHDTPNVKFEFDYRLPVLFRYGWAVGFNQIVIPKGRIVAADPHMDLVDFESRKQFNTLTLANGGVPVRLRKATDVYPTFTGALTDIVKPSSQGQPMQNVGKEWTPLVDDAYEKDAYRPFAGGTKTSAEMLSEAGYTVNAETGRIQKDGVDANDVRPGNLPLGMLERNEYTRDDDAFNGIMPGPILTDAIVEYPWFAYKDKAEENPWGSAYGALFIGAQVKSDENGRITISPLSFPEKVKEMSVFEYEMERQQVVGQVYGVNHEIVPEGAPKWAMWALEDRLNYEGFNPALYAKNNRRGEDAVSSTAYFSTGKYPGYPYDKNYLNHDLHMLASTGRGDNYDPRMNFEYRYSDMGIPGLTDGYNAVKKEISDQKVGMIHHAGDKEYVEMFFRTIDLGQFIEVGSLQIKVGAGSSYAPLVKDAKIACNGTAGIFNVKYVSELQGIFVLEVVDKATADTALEAAGGSVEVFVKYERRGESGVPTFMDWDGICGSVKILFQK